MGTAVCASAKRSAPRADFPKLGTLEGRQILAGFIRQGKLATDLCPGRQGRRANPKASTRSTKRAEPCEAMCIMSLKRAGDVPCTALRRSIMRCVRR